MKNTPIYLRPPIVDDSTDVHTLCFSPDSEQIVAGCGDGSIRIYESAAGRRLYRLFNNKSPVTSVEYKPVKYPSDSLIITAAQANGLITKWAAARGAEIHQEMLSTEIYCMKYSLDGEFYAAAGKDRQIHVFDDETATEMISLRGGNSAFGTVGHSNRVFAVQFDTINHNLLYSTGWDNTVQIWDIRCGYSVQSIHGVQVCGDALDVLGSKLLTGSWRSDQGISIFDIRATQEALKDMRKVTYDYSKSYDEQETSEISVVPELFRFDFNERNFIGKTIEKMPSYEELIEEQLENAEAIDEEKPQSPNLEAEQAAEMEQDVANMLKNNGDNNGISAHAEESTLLYSCKFNKTRPNLITAGGSGGCMMKIIDWEKAEVLQATKAPASIFDICVNSDGRFGAFCGGEFGVQIFSFPEEDE